MSRQLIHFSDPQLVPPGELNYDIDPQQRLRLCVDAILRESIEAEACIITGDLTHWGELAAYQLLKEELDRLPFPTWLLMGNHDCRDNFRQVFPDHPAMEEGFIQFSVESSAGRMICLDTLDDKKRSGILCKKRLEWLEKELAASGDKDVYLFMHHPPFEVGLASMDLDNLINKDDFYQVISPWKARIKHIFFGHLHRSVSGTWQGIGYSCPPSLVHQTPFDFENVRPGVVSPEPPVYNLIQFHDDRVVVHTHNFLHSAPLINSRTCYRYQKPAS